jgi:hypothetical protein
MKLNEDLYTSINVYCSLNSSLIILFPSFWPFCTTYFNTMDAPIPSVYPKLFLIILRETSVE